MKHVELARPYAKAAFEFAKENNAVDAWLSALEQLLAVYQHEEVQALLNQPRITSEQVTEVLVSLTASFLNEHQQNFVRLMIQNRRLSVLEECLMLFKELVAEDQRVVSAEVVTAEAISNEQVAGLKHALEAKLNQTVTLSTEVDPSLIGGAVVRTRDWVIDASLKAQLGAMRKELIRQG